MKRVDWITGFPFLAYTIKLPKGYRINITVSQHQSGKVTVNQTVSKLIGVFNPETLKLEGLNLDTTFLDKLYKFVKFKRVV